MSDGVRRHKRVERNFDVLWALDGGRISGRARLVDISVGGMCLQIDQPLSPGDSSTLSLVSTQVSSLPTKGRVRWCRPVPGRPSAFLCGITFVESSIDTRRWADWVAVHVGQ